MANVGVYQTTGQLAKPLVTLHTTLDPVVPFLHQVLYGAKAAAASGKLTIIPVGRYGHGSFTSEEIMGAFAFLLAQSNGQLASRLSFFRNAVETPIQ